MGWVSNAAGPRVVGRAEELSRLRKLIAAAASGHAPTLLISGEAGLGKTVLARRALADAPPDVVVLSGACLPTHSLSVQLLPLRTAIRTAPTAQTVNHACLTSIDAGRPIEAIDAYLDTVTASAPVILFVDDVQWADRSTLDVLLYLAAGARPPGYAVIATIRTEDAPAGHPIHEWLANVLRLPDVEHRHLGRLDRASTEAQLADLLGAMPHDRLVDEVFAKARGNPFFTSRCRTWTRRLAGYPKHCRRIWSWRWAGSGMSWRLRHAWSRVCSRSVAGRSAPTCSPTWQAGSDAARSGSRWSRRSRSAWWSECPTSCSGSGIRSKRRFSSLRRRWRSDSAGTLRTRNSLRSACRRPGSPWSSAQRSSITTIWRASSPRRTRGRFAAGSWTRPNARHGSCCR